MCSHSLIPFEPRTDSTCSFLKKEQFVSGEIISEFLSRDTHIRIIILETRFESVADPDLDSAIALMSSLPGATIPRGDCGKIAPEITNLKVRGVGFMRVVSGLAHAFRTITAVRQPSRSLTHHGRLSPFADIQRSDRPRSNKNKASRTGQGRVGATIDADEQEPLSTVSNRENNQFAVVPRDWLHRET